MIVHSALHSLTPMDGVGEFCLLFQLRCAALGIENRLYARDIHPSLAARCRPSSELAFATDPDDVLIWHYADSPEVYLAERFPGRRILFHHNVTPPEFYPHGSQMRESCTLALSRLRSLVPAFPLALGASEFTRRELSALGFAETGVFPLFSKIWSPGKRIQAARCADAPVNLVTVCRVVPSKNIEESIEMLAALRRGTPATLTVIGATGQTPDYMRSLERAASRLGLRPGEDIVFTGPLPEPEMRARLNAASGYLCTSRHEGFCLPLLEAMGAGIPVFAVPRTAIEETLGGAGVLLPPDQPEAAAARILATISNPDTLARTLEAQHERLAFFSPENDTRRVASLIETARALPRIPAIPAPASVSVVVCTWNRASHLESCLEALRAQTHEPVEVIVVNGPSTDHSGQVLARYAGQIRVLDNPHRNLSVSRNLGIAAAAGEFVAFLDDDAIAHPEWLCEALSAFRDPLTGAVGGATYRFANGEPEFVNGILLETGHPLAVQPLPGAFFDGYRGRWNTVRGNNCVFRRDALVAVGGFDERFEYAHEEADIALRLAKAGWRVRHRPLAIVHHSSQPSRNRSSEFDLNWRANLKNTVYCAMKNRPRETVAPLFLARVMASNLRVRIRDAWEWWLQRRVSFGLLLKIAAGCVAGTGEGVAKWLLRSPAHLPATADSKGEGFLPYPHAAAKRTVAHLTQEVPFRAPTGVGYSSIWLGGALNAHGYRNHLIARGSEDARDARDGCWFHFAPDAETDSVATALAEFPDARRAFARSVSAWHALQELAVRDGVRAVISPLWESEGLVAALDPRFQVVPVVITPIHEVCRIEGRPLTGSAALLSDFERALLGRAAAVVGISQASLRDVLAFHQVEPETQQVIPHGIPDPMPGWAPRETPPPRVLFVGPASRRKGTPELLRAIPLILEHCPDAEFDIVGSLPVHRQSEEARWIEEFCAKHPRAADRTRFHGNVSDAQKNDLYMRARVLAMPSHYESFGIPAAEAQAFGIPVVAAEVGGLPEVVEGDVTALLIPAGDADSLARATVRLLEDDELWRAMSANARFRFERNFTQVRMGERYAALLRQLNGDFDHRFPPLAVAEADTLPHSARTVLWRDPLYARRYQVLPRGEPGEWIRLPGLALGRNRATRIDVFCGVHPRLLPQAVLCHLTLAGETGDVVWRTTFRASALPSAPWGILSATVQVDNPPPRLTLEIQGAGDVDLRIQRVEVREV